MPICGFESSANVYLKIWEETSRSYLWGIKRLLLGTDNTIRCRLTTFISQGSRSSCIIYQSNQIHLINQQQKPVVGSGHNCGPIGPIPPLKGENIPKGVTSAHHFPHVQPSMWHKYVGSSLLSLVPTHIYVYVSNKTMTTRKKGDTGEIIKYKFFFSVLYGLSVWFK